jgi:hypothetical protein
MRCARSRVGVGVGVGVVSDGDAASQKVMLTARALFGRTTSSRRVVASRRRVASSRRRAREVKI